jgi:transposase
MLVPGSNTKIYLYTGLTDMRKGVNGLSLLAQDILSNQFSSGAMFVFRGKSATRLKILWWDQQGFCLFYKCLDSGKFPWLNTEDKTSVGITRAQLSMLIEGVELREIRSGLNLLNMVVSGV